ncbi:unnamed protein product [Thelazia callipaeda]|uniref:FERM domain-containing protein n=1 Tax=Thelazia callipaeda TaxID=103827 RepID=A0A0N5CNA4_THECL|nr:unnamed protein product [Thelazia callipaeda]
MALSLLYDECRYNYLKGLYWCSDRDLISLAAIMLQIVYGSKIKLTEKTLATIIPMHRLPSSSKELKAMLSRIESEHRTRNGTNLIKLQQIFLQICWRFNVYGATFFDAIIFMKKPVSLNLPVKAGVNDYGLHLINAQTMVLIQSYPIEGLKWVLKVDRPYIEISTRSGADLILSTPQVT